MSADQRPADGGPLPALLGRREQVLDLLSKHFAAGHIELEDMERRMEIAARAVTASDLESALSGIVRAQPAAPAAGTAVAKSRPRVRRTVAFLGGHHREGRWTAPLEHKATAVMGGVQLDYRDAVFEGAASELELFVMFGGVQIIVPPDLDVEVDGSAILGGLHNGAMEIEGTARRPHRLVVHARVIMGGVDVKIMDREEPGAASPPGTPPSPGTP